MNQRVLQALRPYFPEARLVPQTMGIEVETNVTAGIGRDLCIELFRSFAARPEFKQMEQAFGMAKYSFLAINLGDNTIIWQPAERYGFRVVTRAESNTPVWRSAPLLALQ